jgi:hypothetical protein
LDRTCGDCCTIEALLMDDHICLEGDKCTNLY